jgi:hypothetical protein
MAGIGDVHLQVQQKTGVLARICRPCAPPVMSMRVSGDIHGPGAYLIMFSSVERPRGRPKLVINIYYILSFEKNSILRNFIRIRYK